MDRKYTENVSNGLRRPAFLIRRLILEVKESRPSQTFLVPNLNLAAACSALLKAIEYSFFLFLVISQPI